MNRTRAKNRTRMGRPPLPRSQVRSNRVVTFVTNSEMADLTRGADEAGLSLSAFVYQTLTQQHSPDTPSTTEE